MRRLTILLLLFFTLLVQLSHAQGKKKSKGISYSKKLKKIEMQLIRKALKNVQFVNYEEDIRDYAELLKIDSANMQYNFGMAMALYSNFEEPKSVPYFERAFRHPKDTIGDAYYFLANSC